MKSPDRQQQLKELYNVALERAAGERRSFLAEACAGDEELRHELESLLGYQARAEAFIETPLPQLATELLATDLAASLVGRRIGHYHVLARIGAGGMGEVFLAEDTRLGRKVALKLLPAKFTSDPTRVRRFEREARAASALNHPNILTIHEIGQASTDLGGIHFIATEFIEGETLRERLARGGVDLTVALDVAAQIAAALAAAHDAGIMHRDIKPENVMLRRDGYVKVLDFGLAKLIEPQSAEVDIGAPTATADDRAGNDHGHGGLYVTGAVAHRGRRCARGYLEPGRRALRNDRRAPSFRRSGACFADRLNPRTRAAAGPKLCDRDPGSA